MSTLAEIEQADDALPLEEQKVLFVHLAERIGKATEKNGVPSGPLCAKPPGFPISRGRIAFTSEDVARLETDPNGAATLCLALAPALKRRRREQARQRVKIPN